MTIADELTKLHTLKEQGALTEEEFNRAKTRVLCETALAATTPKARNPLNDLARSSTDRWIGGVCGGLAVATNLPAWTWRILFILATLLHGLGIVMYVLLWIFVPLRLTPAPNSQQT